MTTEDNQLTRMLQAGVDGPETSQELLALVYSELRKIAQSRMASERAGHTLQATALVHEAYMKLVGAEEISWEGRRHFYGAAAEAMRRVLIDHARRVKSEKRGGGAMRVTLGGVDAESEYDPDQFLALADAMERLEREDERSATVVRLRFFSGLSVEEIAKTLDVSERTVHREWTFARARLFELLEE